MNPHIQLEITNEMLVTKNFINSCRVAAMKDDGIIDKDEQKLLNKIAKASNKFIKELEKLS